MFEFLEDLLGVGAPGIIAGVAGIGLFVLLVAILKAFIKVKLPDKLLVITGKKRTRDGKTFGFSVERGRAISVPYFQSAQELDLGVIPINVRVEGVNSANGITVGADATACVCIDDDDEGMLYSAVERLMGKNRDQIKSQIQQTLVGNFRGALNKATPLQAIGMEDVHGEEDLPEEAKGERAQFRAELLADINSDLSSFGMKVVSVSLQKIWDTSNYIANLAQKTLAEKRQQVEIEEARLRARAEKAESDSEKRKSVAENTAEEAILSASERYEVYKRESDGLIAQARLEADQSIQEAVNIGEKELESEKVELQRLENETKVTLKAKAEQETATIIAQGERESVEIIEGARNEILRKKAELLSNAGDAGRAVLFIQQQLPRLFEAYKAHAQTSKVDNFLVMDDDQGFKGAVNRGPEAFVEFLSQFQKGLGIDVKGMLSTGTQEAAQ